MAAPIKMSKFSRYYCLTRRYHKKVASMTTHVEKMKGSLTKEEMPIDPEVLHRLQDGTLKARKNPGIMRLKNVVLPERLENAVKLLVKKYGNTNLVKDSVALSDNLMNRQLPLEKGDIAQRKKEILNKLLTKDNVDIKSMSGEEQEDYREKLKDQVERELKKKYLSHWSNKQYDAKSGMRYMIARIAQNYAVLLQVLNEIWRRDPTYVPKTLYNYGSGIGSAIWAIQNNPSWHQEISQYHCVDPSMDINTIARLLLQDGKENDEMHVKNVFFRKFSPSPLANSFSTVISAYTLIEHDSQESRLKTIQSLWDMTDDYLILVEMGTYAGHRLIQEARDFILKVSKDVEEDKQGHVFAPCPHQLQCPKMKMDGRVPCAFSVNYVPLRLISKSSYKRMERFTYIILRKGKTQEDGIPWPRLVANSTHASRHIHCRMCCPNGELDHVIITKTKHSKEGYSVARKLDLGDLLPMIYREEAFKRNKVQTEQNNDIKHVDKEVSVPKEQDIDVKCANSTGSVNNTGTQSIYETNSELLHTANN